MEKDGGRLPSPFCLSFVFRLFRPLVQARKRGRTKGGSYFPNDSMAAFAAICSPAPQNQRFCGVPLFSLLGGNEFRLRQGFGSAKTLVTRHSARKRGRTNSGSYLFSRSMAALAAICSPAPQNQRFCGAPFFSLLGGNEFRLRQGFGSAKTLVTRHSARKRGRTNSGSYLFSRSMAALAAICSASFLVRPSP